MAPSCALTDRLPTELLLIILGHVNTAHDLSGLALTCTRLWAVSRPAVFSKITLRSYAKCAELVALLVSRPFLARHICQLTVVGEDMRSRGRDYHRVEHVGWKCWQNTAALHQLASLLDNVVRVAFRDVWGYVHDDHGITDFHIALRPILASARVLTLHNVYFPSLDAVRTLLADASSLEELFLWGVRTDASAQQTPERPQDLPCQTRLKHININVYSDTVAIHWLHKQLSLMLCPSGTMGFVAHRRLYIGDLNLVSHRMTHLQVLWPGANIYDGLLTARRSLMHTQPTKVLDFQACIISPPSKHIRSNVPGPTISPDSASCRGPCRAIAHSRISHSGRRT